MHLDDIRAQRAELVAAIDRRAIARTDAMTALRDVEARLEAATAELGRARLAARLGEGKASDASKLGQTTAVLERERAELQDVLAEAGRQLAVAEAELALLDQAERSELYRQAVAQRDRAVQVVAAAVADLVPKLDELRRLERAALSAGQAAGTGHAHRWQAEFDANLAERLGLAHVRPIYRRELASFAAAPSGELAPSEA
jgi:Zn-dependent alcohol dehydrogenase